MSVAELDAEGILDVEDLLGHYAAELRATDQEAEAERIADWPAPPRSTS